MHTRQATLKENKELLAIYQQFRQEASAEIAELKAEIRCVSRVWTRLGGLVMRLEASRASLLTHGRFEGRQATATSERRGGPQSSSQ